MDTKDLIISTCAVVGAVLGVFNFVRGYLADSERLRVTSVAGGQDAHPGVQVVNRSPFPVTVVEIGYVHADGELIVDTPHYGHVINPRQSNNFSISLREAIARQVYGPNFTFVRTALGGVFTDEARLARWWRRALELTRLKKQAF